MFLLFDSTHNIKNVFNSFEKRREFSFPSHELLSATCADYGHIEELCEFEDNKALKVAYKLPPNVLHPTSVERVSTKHALSIFCESTESGLRFYSESISKPWAETASFVGLVTKYWKILNVKTPTKGEHKTDYNQGPITSSFDHKLLFLRQI